MSHALQTWSAHSFDPYINTGPLIGSFHPGIIFPF